MLYTSLEFLVLLAATVVIFLALPGQRARSITLIVSSLLFYAWAGFFDFAVFLFVVILSWLAAWMATRNPASRRAWTTLGALALTAHLVFWKYVPWIHSNLSAEFPSLGWRPLYLPLPVGISFFTFQGIAYLIDLGRGEAEMMSFRDYLLFKSFFAQLIAGPIVRAREILPQLRRLQTPTAEDFGTGILLFSMGLFKKFMIADHVSLFVTTVFSAPRKFDRETLILGMFGFTAQIWADFSGYTDMGRGAARMLGIHLPENFLSPLLARTPTELWKRWHITMGRWMRDYVFLPLYRWTKFIGNRSLRAGLAALVTFIVVGFWHGANWTYLVWGLFFGAFVLVEALLRRSPISGAWDALPDWPRRVLLTSLTLAGSIIGLTIFRSGSVGQFFEYLQALIGGNGGTTLERYSNPVYRAWLYGASLQILLYYDLESERWPVVGALVAIGRRSARLLRLEGRIEHPGFLRLVGAAAGILLGVALAASIAYRQYENVSSFIYFQF